MINIVLKILIISYIKDTYIYFKQQKLKIKLGKKKKLQTTNIANYCKMCIEIHKCHLKMRIE